MSDQTPDAAGDGHADRHGSGRLGLQEPAAAGRGTPSSQRVPRPFRPLVRPHTAHITAVSPLRPPETETETGGTLPREGAMPW